MDQPVMRPAAPLGDDIFALQSYYPAPPFGLIPVNAYLLRGREPILVDAGMAPVSAAFERALAAVIDPAELRWIYLTHGDPDHTGNLARLLELAPAARVVTTYLGMAKLQLLGLPVDRVYLLNPGQTLVAGEHELVALVPPAYDAPETTAVFEARSRSLFSSDCFGAVLQAPHDEAAAIPASELRDGMATWAAADTPWLASVLPEHLEHELRAVRDLAPRRILGTHLPPAIGLTDQLADLLPASREAPPFRGPDQAELDQLLGRAGG